MPSDDPILHYAVLLFPMWELLDAAGPLEALNTLPRRPTFPYGDRLTFSIIAETLDPVSTGPVKGDPQPFNPLVAQAVVPTHTFDDPPKDIDVLIVPGGWGAGPRLRSGFEPDVRRVTEFIRGVYPKLKYLFTICNGSTLAARAGVLDGLEATTNKAAWEIMTSTGPKTHWVAKARWVVTDGGKIWTTSGVSAGMDGFLALIDHIYGPDKNGDSYGDICANGMEYRRIRDMDDDDFAVLHGAKDVLPVQ